MLLKYFQQKYIDLNFREKAEVTEEKRRKFTEDIHALERQMTLLKKLKDQESN